MFFFEEKNEARKRLPVCLLMPRTQGGLCLDGKRMEKSQQIPSSSSRENFQDVASRSFQKNINALPSQEYMYTHTHRSDGILIPPSQNRDHEMVNLSTSFFTCAFILVSNTKEEESPFEDWALHLCSLPCSFLPPQSSCFSYHFTH